MLVKTNGAEEAGFRTSVPLPLSKLEELKINSKLLSVLRTDGQTDKFKDRHTLLILNKGAMKASPIEQR